MRSGALPLEVFVEGDALYDAMLGDIGHAERSVLLSCGVRIFEHAPRVLHAKTLVVDDGGATVGTANLDYRSLFVNDELNLVDEGGDAPPRRSAGGRVDGSSQGCSVNTGAKPPPGVRKFVVCP